MCRHASPVRRGISQSSDEALCYRMIDRSTVLVVAAVLTAAAVGAWIAIRLHDLLDRRQRRHRSAIGQAGERSAQEWLTAHGFTIRGVQSRLTARMVVDGVIEEYEVCADYVVERNGRRAVVEVKTGASAHPTARATRRQIFEYAALFDVEQVFVFDANLSRLHAVSFEAVGRRRHVPLGWVRWRSGFLSGIAAAGIAAAIWRVMSGP
jgi:hypothetical protein